MWLQVSSEYISFQEDGTTPAHAQADSFLYETRVGNSPVFPQLLHFFNIIQKRQLHLYILNNLQRISQQHGTSSNGIPSICSKWVLELLVAPFDVKRAIQEHNCSLVPDLEQSVEQFKVQCLDFVSFLRKQASTSETTAAAEELVQLVKNLNYFKEQELYFMTNVKVAGQTSTQQTLEQEQDETRQKMEQFFLSRCRVMFAGKDLLQQITSTASASQSASTTPSASSSMYMNWKDVIKGLKEQSKVNIRLLFDKEKVATINDLFFVKDEQTIVAMKEKLKAKAVTIPTQSLPENLEKLLVEHRALPKPVPTTSYAKRIHSEMQASSEVSEKEATDSFFIHETKRQRRYDTPKEKEYLKRMPLWVHEGHLVKQEQLGIIGLSKVLKDKLRDDRLQQILIDIDTSRDRERKLDEYMRKDSEFTKFVNETLFAIGERELHMEEYKLLEQQEEQ